MGVQKGKERKKRAILFATEPDTYIDACSYCNSQLAAARKKRGGCYEMKNIDDATTTPSLVAIAEAKLWLARYIDSHVARLHGAACIATTEREKKLARSSS